MTALDEFDRLEAVGRLKRSPEDRGVEVVVTFGEATLTMNELKATGDTPVSHWSIAAVNLLSQDKNAAVFSLDSHSNETLTVEDPTFRDAMMRVLQNRPKAVPKGRERRWLKFGIGLIALVVAAAFIVPNMVARTAASMISPERAEILAKEMMPMIHARTGPACETPLSETALRRITDRLNPDGNALLKIHDMGDVGTISLPGGQVLLSEQVLAEAKDTATVFAWAAIGIAGMIDSPAVTELFANNGMWDAVSFLAKGELPQTAKERAINKMFIEADEISPEVARNAELLLRNAALPVAGLDRILGRTPSDDPQQSNDILTAQEWQSLGRACSG